MTVPGGTGMAYDHRVSEALLAALEPGGPLASLIDLRNLRRDLLDVQFRRSRRRRRSRAVLYAGSATLLVADERGGRFRLRLGSGPRSGRCRPAAAGGEVRRGWMDAAAIEAAWPDVAAFLHRHLAETDTSDPDPLAGLCGAIVDTHRIVARPAAVRLEDTGVQLPAPADADLLAIDGDGRVLVVAVASAVDEPSVLAPQRARLHAELFARLVNDEDPTAAEALAGMAEQRVRVRLDGGTVPPFSRPVAVVPVVAAGLDERRPDRWASLAAEIERLERPAAVARLEPLEVWWLDAEGRPEVSDRRAVTAPFAVRARAAAAAWRRTTDTIPDEARDPPAGGPRPGGPDDEREDELRLPSSHADANLLPDARQRALERFAAAGRAWPGGGPGRPSPHLLSASVQCANALAPLVDDPYGLAAILASTVPVSRVLPFGAPLAVAGRFGRDDHVVFGWSGLAGPSPPDAGPPVAADAAIRYETAAGDVEIALLAWVYAGDPGRSPGIVTNPEPACRHDPDGPLRTDLVADADLAVEPFTTLVGLQCLAWRMERAGELGARRVRVVLCAPAANRGLVDALTPVHRRLGGGPGALAHAPVATMADAWRALLRRPDRFAFLDTAHLVAPGAPTSWEFKRRYHDLADAAPDAGFGAASETTEAPAWPVTRSWPPDRAAVEARVRDAAAVARVVAREALVDRDVLGRVAEGEPDELATWSTVELAEIAARLEELAGLVHRLRFGPPP